MSTPANIRAKNHAVVAQDFKFKGETSRVVGDNGEVNASSKKDLLTRNMQLMQATASGQVTTASAMEERQRIIAANQELLLAAFDNKTAHRVLGEKMADQLYMTANRKGYARRLLSRVDLKQGDIPRFAVRKKNVQAVLLTGPTDIATQIALDKWLTPPEMTIGTRVFVPQTEINQSNTDVLEEKFIEGLEAVMVTEDRLHYNLCRATIGIDNNLSIISGTLSPLTFMSVRQQVQRWGLKPMYCTMASDLFVDIVADSGFQAAIEPVARHELVMTGEMAVLYGMTLISEDYRHPEHKVLSQGEFMITSDPLFHGAYSDRGGVDSQPIDTVNERKVGRGWIFQESMAMAVANTRSVAFGSRA